MGIVGGRDRGNWNGNGNSNDNKSEDVLFRVALCIFLVDV